MKVSKRRYVIEDAFDVMSCILQMHAHVLPATKPLDMSGQHCDEGKLHNCIDAQPIPPPSLLV